MRLLYVSGTYAARAWSGSELSAHTLLRVAAADHGIDVLVATDMRYTGGEPRCDYYDGIALLGMRYEDRAAGIDSAILQFRPDVLFTQLSWADAALRAAGRNGIPSVLRAASMPVSTDLRRGSPTAPTAVVVASQFMAAHVRDVAGREAVIIPPCIDLDRVLSTGLPTRRFTTMFNPIQVKGGEVFRAIAVHLPQREFAYVPGWSVLRDEKGGWDKQIWDQSVASQGLEPWPTPVEADFTGLRNVTKLMPRDDVGEIYRQTRLLCIPSQWEEPFGRVAIEAFANGVPVIASAAGGLREHASLAGILLPTGAGVDDWVRAIESLDDTAAYESLARQGPDVARASFGFSATVEPFINLLRRIAARA